MKCANCRISIKNNMLHRVNPKGEIAIWWCESCIKKIEPELYKNIKMDETKVEKILKKMFH